MNTQAKKDEFIKLIAAMTQDGENDFIMENDDAVMTLNELIETARELTAEQPKTYTVILLYPDHMTDDFGADIYVDSAEAESIEAAVKIVQEMAVMSNTNDAVGSWPAPEDFRCIGVIEGEHNFVADATSF